MTSRNRRRQELGTPDWQEYSTPPESTQIVMLKTLMDLRESFGKLSTNVEQLTKSVKEVRDKQDELDRTFAKFKTVAVVVGWLIGTLAALATIYECVKHFFP